MKDFEKPVFYVKDSKKTLSPSVVDWKKKQIKGAYRWKDKNVSFR